MLTPLITLALASATTAHFVLEFPTSLGYNDEKLTESPCGSFDPLDRSKGVTDWPVSGNFISLISTHGDVTWDINAALISEGATTWVPLVVPFKQTGVGFVCFDVVPGNPDWVGREAVVQIIQHAVDGLLHQCAAVRFVAGGPAVATCENTGGVSHDPIVAPPRPGTTSTTSTTTSPITSPTSTSTTTVTTTTPTTSATSTGSGTSSTSKTTSSTSTGGSHDHDDGHSHGTGTGVTTKPPTVTAGADQLLAPAVPMLAGAAAAAFAWGMH